jgi:hypothetical protein
MIEYKSKHSIKELPFQVDQKMGSSPGTQQRAPTDRGGSDRATVPVSAGFRAASIAEQPRGREGRGTVGSAGPALAKPLGGG